MIRYALFIGETLTIPFFIESGDPTGLTVTAWMKRVDVDEDKVQLGCAFRAAVGTVGQLGYVAAGWNVSITTLVSAALEPGGYRVQLKFQPAAGDPEFSQPVAVSVREGPAT